MNTVFLFAVMLGALFQFGCASGPKQEAAMRDRSEERQTAKKQAEFVRSLPPP
jgi:hypothetical protein